jgi:hypothetical protein
VPAADALCSAAGLRLADDPRPKESRRRRELCVSRCGSSNEGSTGFLDGGGSVVWRAWSPVHSGDIHGRHLFRNEQRSRKHRYCSTG